jgi:hypothetical protein
MLMRRRRDAMTTMRMLELRRRDADADADASIGSIRCRCCPRWLEEAGKHVGELKKYDLDEKSPVRQEEHKA